VTSSPARQRGLSLALFAVAFGTNVPTPLLLIYRDRLGMSATLLTVMFAVYAVGLVPALLLAGPASDRLGRRPLVMPFVLLSGVASVVLLFASGSLAALLIGRLLQGAVSGVVFSVGSAWLGELSDDVGKASRRAATALSLGFSLGPLTSGLLAQWAPAPTVVPYVLHLGLLALAAFAVPRVPETVVATPGRGRLLNLGVPVAARPAFLSFVLPVALCVFTFPAVAVTILPLGVRAAMPGADLAVTGLVAGLSLGVGVLVQPLEARLGAVRAAPLAAGSGAAGVALGWLATGTGQPAVLLPAAVLLGAAYGLALASGLTATQWLAAPEARGALVATFYAITYLGFASPVVLSALSTGTEFGVALAGLALFALAIALWLGVGPGRRRLLAARPVAPLPPEPPTPPVPAP
jgi:predicted MFS family arabinose efflux permease